MEWGSTTWAFAGVGAAAVATSLVTLRRRLQLSMAKHASLTGHARMARWVASFVPFYQYDEARFFCSDDAPQDIAALRRSGLARLSAVYRTRFAETIRRTEEVSGGISDLQFTEAYRVPFQYGAFLRQHLKFGAFVQSSEGVNDHRSGWQQVLRPDRLLRRQCPRLRLLQGGYRPRRRARARAWPGARQLSSR
jgi:glutamate-1-semialdehyde 2,1-aminomutase